MDTSEDKIQRRIFATGTGDWRFFDYPMSTVHEAAQHWKRELIGVEKPWLCWNVDHDWCLAQQRQVKSVGWTPVVGYDPRIGPPEIIKGAILIDFNKTFRFPTMWLHFPLEFAHLFCKKLAFWHADLLLRQPVAEKYALLFEKLEDGEMAATPDYGGISRKIFRRHTQRYWEVLGCTTQGASNSQFENGCGWWKGFFDHPQNKKHPEIQRNLRKYYWDCGVGIMYWKRNIGGKIYDLNFKEVNEGHCTGIGRKDYIRSSPNNELRDLNAELSSNYDLREVCKRLDVTFLLHNI
ncbi:hypothetical protein [Allochromatium palmeri]|uniref:Uncharacterized protein n=1 Tax=Allochromatium palmeri TaxID=231048 RepID=A0A6N8EA90_9GAMM|nr:hypothetical protein [Allochromatium palmeri]MTW21192.1 hypothetical protein [Allochromatium palmeri]